MTSNYKGEHKLARVMCILNKNKIQMIEQLGHSSSNISVQLHIELQSITSYIEANYPPSIQALSSSFPGNNTTSKTQIRLLFLEKIYLQKKSSDKVKICYMSTEVNIFQTCSNSRKPGNMIKIDGSQKKAPRF